MLNKNKRRRRLLVIGIMVIFIVVIMIIYKGNDIIPKYIAEEEITTDKNADIEYEYVTPFADEKLKLYIPKGLKRIDDGSNVFYISDDVSLTVEKLSYNYMVGMLTAETYVKTLSGDVNMLSFIYPTTSSRLLSYSRQEETGSTVNVVYTIWDRQKIINISYETPMSKYESSLSLIKKSIDNCLWERNYPIAEDLCLFYSSPGNFEFAIPYGYIQMDSDAYLFACKNDNDTIMMTVELYENPELLSDFDALSYTNYISGGKHNFTLKYYDYTDNYVMARSTYSDNNDMINMYQYIYASGKYQYFITYYVYSQALTDNVVEMINNAFNYFRLY